MALIKKRIKHKGQPAIVVDVEDDRGDTVAVSAAFQAEQDSDEQDRVTWREAWPVARDRLIQIGDQAETVRTQAQALSSITLTGTAAQKLDQVQVELRRIGTGVALLAEMHKDEALYLRRLARLTGRHLAGMLRADIGEGTSGLQRTSAAPESVSEMSDLESALPPGKGKKGKP